MPCYTAAAMERRAAVAPRVLVKKGGLEPPGGSSYTKAARLFPDLRGGERHRAYHRWLAQRAKQRDDVRAAAQFNVGMLHKVKQEQASRPRRDVVAQEDLAERQEQVTRDRSFQAAMAAAGVR